MLLPNRRFRHRASSAFTLVELLVVIAIIGILATLLVVALPGYLQSGKKTVSASNLKQWYSGFGGALRDNDGTLPTSGFPSFKPDDEAAWYNAMPRALGIKPLRLWTDTPDQPKLGESSIWNNPVVTAKYNQGGKYVFTYGYNELLRQGSADDSTPLKIGAIKHPQITVLMGEKADLESHLNVRNVKAFFGTGRPEDKGDPDNEANFLFCDGHVEAVKRKIFADLSLSSDEAAVRNRTTKITFLVVED